MILINLTRINNSNVSPLREAMKEVAQRQQRLDTQQNEMQQKTKELKVKSQEQIQKLKLYA